MCNWAEGNPILGFIGLEINDLLLYLLIIPSENSFMHVLMDHVLKPLERPISYNDSKLTEIQTNPFPPIYVINVPSCVILLLKPISNIAGWFFLCACIILYFSSPILIRRKVGFPLDPPIISTRIQFQVWLLIICYVSFIQIIAALLFQFFSLGFTIYDSAIYALLFPLLYIVY